MSMHNSFSSSSTTTTSYYLPLTLFLHYYSSSSTTSSTTITSTTSYSFSTTTITSYSFSTTTITSSLPHIFLLSSSTATSSSSSSFSSSPYSSSPPLPSPAALPEHQLHTSPQHAEGPIRFETTLSHSAPTFIYQTPLCPLQIHSSQHSPNMEVHLLRIRQQKVSRNIGARTHIPGGARRHIPGGARRHIPGGARRHIPGGARRHIPGGACIIVVTQITLLTNLTNQPYLTTEPQYLFLPPSTELEGAYAFTRVRLYVC